MDFSLSPEQQMLRDSVRRILDKTFDFDARVRRLAARRPCDDALWRLFADHGWLAAALPEAAGGLGGGIVETTLIAHELGRALVVEPYLGSAVLAAQVLAGCLGQPGAEVAAAWLAGIGDGSRRVALTAGDAVRLKARRTGDGYRLDGTAALVIGGADAQAFVVAAALDGGGEDPTALFIVEAGAAGVGRCVLPLHDGSWAAELTLLDVPLQAAALLAGPGRGGAALALGLAHGTAALCAELVGGMERAIEITADYLKVRQQFGVPIASFQALQHRMADMAAELELARSMLYALLASLANDDAATVAQQASLAKMLVGRAARWVTAQAIQLHGGIGMTEECAIGHYFKRAVVADVLLGSADTHEARAAAQLQRALRAESEAA
jgi:alkylation response protein AidB-like acyl-CoA dehydrogenase